MNIIIFLLGVVVGTILTYMMIRKKLSSKSSGDLCIANDEGGDYIFLRAKVPISEFKKKMAVSFRVINVSNSRENHTPL